MTTEITKPLTHAIITYSKSHYFLTNEQNEYLKRIPLTGSIEINGNIIKAANIAEIMTMAEYWHQHETREEHINYPELPKIIPATFSKQRTIRALESIIRGFKQHFGERELPPQSKIQLFKMEERLKIAKL